MDSSYVPLVSRSEYSLLQSGTHLVDLVDYAARLGYKSLGLTDVNALYGIVEFQEACARQEIHPVFGSILDHGPHRIVALIQDQRGYSSLCQILSGIHLDPDLDLIETVHEHQTGLILLVADPYLASVLHRRGIQENLWMELIRPTRSQARERKVLEAARDLNLKLVASGDIHFARPDDFDTYRVLFAIRNNALQTDIKERISLVKDLYLRTPLRAEALFHDQPDARLNTRRIAETCQFNPIATYRIFPRYNVPPDETPISVLYQSCHEGLKRRYRPIPSRTLSRLAHELEIIDRLGFAEYFLVVRDIVSESRRRGVPIAGRGSGASSLVAYVLGITNVCPLKFNLSFERFLNEKRTSPPDLDIDFCWRIRDEIIQSVFDTFGQDRVAMVSTHITLQARSAFRETAKTHGLSEEQVSILRSKLPGDFDAMWTTSVGAHNTVSNQDKKSPTWDPGSPPQGPAGPGDDGLTSRLRGLGRRLFVSVEKMIKITEDARRILDFPQHLSVHPGGIVIGQLPISHHTPLQRAEKGVIISQFDKDSIEPIGLVKIDLLGNRALSTIRETLDRIEDYEGTKPDIETFPDEDPATLDLMQRGDTIGCNQLESPAMRNLLRQVQPQRLRDVMITLALIRPGAASLGMKEEFIKRRRGLSPWQVPHPALDGFLAETYGVMVYEDDAMLVASALTSLTLEDADRFRKSIQKCRDDDERITLSRRFLDHCRQQNVAENVAKDLWIQMAKFNAYSFCKSHAASYALLAYAAAYLKAHYPLPFWVAALNNNQGLYDKRVYIEEAKRRGLPIFHPCVNESDREFSLGSRWNPSTPDPPKGGDSLGTRSMIRGIQVGLDRIRGLSSKSIEQILQERAMRPFVSLSDLMSRVKLRREEVRSLILSGALDFTLRRRPCLMLELETLFVRLQGSVGTDRLFVPENTEIQPELGDFTEFEKFTTEFEILELSPRRHMLEYIRPSLTDRGLIDSRDLPDHVNQTISLIGILDASRRTTVRTGESMEFITLEDEWGVFECILFPEVYRRYSRLIRSVGPYRIWARVEVQFDSMTLTLTRLESLAESLSALIGQDSIGTAASPLACSESASTPLSVDGWQ